ncbi:LysR family transcriptional regulator [Sinorhizobium meliloti]|uniref:LysR family transcriptional regulator n=1 Tax=Rhizobium meliloti TaxID=382 RepID=UPI000B49E469|nr:LysR family transcriptional regulator [Sinorhizobium meliloti]ASQ13163.1 LysR family transcriptional regulator [Sinorhizobium meliloti]MQU84774.1 LysR family transcriptional regulator [Sinorhizobium meliloti]MQU86419.1 LysR family transcriptional regulator [Sinorhizobium meliloti]
MDQLAALSAFVHSADTGSFVAAGRQLGLSASAVGKAVARLEQRLDARLFHRNTRHMTLTEEGRIFLNHCRRIFEEVEAAEAELAQASRTPRGRLRVSMPLVGMLLTPVLANFMRAYPEVQLDLDFTDRLVDVVEEGFDVVIRTGRPSDSRLMSRNVGRFRLRIVASPAYLENHGVPRTPHDLAHHRCLHQRSPTTGKLRPWPFARSEAIEKVNLPEAMSATAIDPLICLAVEGLGIACLPPFAVRNEIGDGRLISLLEDHVVETDQFSVLWPAGRQLTPKVRALVDFLAENMFREDDA